MDMSVVSELKSLQKKVNSGNGISCVNTIIFFLENDRIDSAEACVINEWDKISGYPVLTEYIKNNIYNPCIF